MNGGLPKKWTATNLFQLCTITTGKRDVNEGNPNGRYPFFTCAQKVYKTDTYEFEGKAILIAGNGFFNVKYYDGKFNAYQRTYVLQNFSINPKYLYRYIDFQLDYITKNNRGSTVKYIRLGDLTNHIALLPPLNEQKRIAAKLDKIMPKIDALRERLDRIPQIIKRFRLSVLTAAVTEKLTEEWREEHPDVESSEALIKRIKKEREYRYQEECDIAKKMGRKAPKKPKFFNIMLEKSDDSFWNSIKIGNLFNSSDIFDGPFGSNLKTSDYTDSGVRVIRLENIDSLNFLDSKKTYISHNKYKTLTKHTVKQGDIIFSSFISGNVRTVVLPKLSEEAIAKADCFCLRPINSLINKYFLTYILSSRLYHNLFQNEIHGATRPRINTTQLKKTVIPLPPLEEQKEIVRQVDKLFAFADKLEAHYNKAKEKIDKLSRSVLAKTFRGELVPQNPNDEPASKLLKRIIAEKEKRRTEIKMTRKRKVKSTIQEKGK